MSEQPKATSPEDSGDKKPEGIFSRIKKNILEESSQYSKTEGQREPRARIKIRKIRERIKEQAQTTEQRTSTQERMETKKEIKEADMGAGFMYAKEQREKDDKKILENLKKITEGHEAAKVIRKLSENIEARKAFMGTTQESDDRKFKEDIIAALKDNKHAIQRADSARVENIYIDMRRQHGSEFMPVTRGRKEKFWHAHSTRVAYNDAWMQLAAWAKEKKIWDEKDEYLFRKETWGPDKDKERIDTLKIIGINTMTGALHGGMYVGAKAFMLPWTGFKFALERMLTLSGVLDAATIQKMMDSISRKRKEKEEKKGGEKKKEEPAHAKEREQMIKVKKFAQEDLKDLRPRGLTPRQIKDVKGSEEYKTLAAKEGVTKKEKKEFLDNKKLHVYDKEIQQSPEYAALTTTEAKFDFLVKQREENRQEWNAYRQAWLKTRRYWIEQQLWDAEDEREFRGELDYDKDTNEIQDVRRDFMTDLEWKNLEQLRTNRRTEEYRLKSAEPNRVQEINEKITNLTAQIDQIINDAKDRFEKDSWPPYKKGKGGGRRRRGGGAQGTEPESESAADTEDDEGGDE